MFFYKTNLIFLYTKQKPIFFSLVPKTDLIFLNQKTLFYLIKQIWFFFFTKNYFVFFYIYKNRSDFFKTKSNFFYYKTDLNCFSKEDDTLINRLMWLSLVKVFHVYNISFIACIKGYISHEILEDQTLSGRNGYLTPSHSIT